MAWAFLAVTLVGACFTANAFRPVRIEPFTVPSFFAGWLTSELPLHHLAWQVVATVVFGALGAFRGWPGWAGLGIALAQWCGLIVLAVQAGRAGGRPRSRWTRVSARGGLTGGIPPSSAPVLPSGPTSAWWSRSRGLDRPWNDLRDVAYWDDGTRRHRLDIYPSASASRRARPCSSISTAARWIFGDKREQGLPLMDYLASRGWVCVTANYGLSPRVAFPEHLVDCKRALSWVRRAHRGLRRRPRFRRCRWRLGGGPPGRPGRPDARGSGVPAGLRGRRHVRGRLRPVLRRVRLHQPGRAPRSGAGADAREDGHEAEPAPPRGSAYERASPV